MPNTQTINGLVTLVRQRSDQINSSTFDDESEIKPWIRGSLAQLYALLTRRAVDYYTTCRPISLMAGVEAYSLPSDFQALQDVFLLYAGGSSRIQLRNFSVDQMGALNTPQPVANPVYKYRIMRNLLFLQPVPVVDSYNALEMYYTPQYRPPLIDYSPLDDVLPNGFEEWVVLDVLGKMSVKTRLQNMDDIRKTQAVIQQQVMATAQIRDSFAPVMRDAYRGRNLVPSYAASGGPLYWCIP